MVSSSSSLSSTMKVNFAFFAGLISLAWGQVPYPPSGYRPSRQFLLPNQQQAGSAAQQQLGAPQQQFGAQRPQRPQQPGLPQRPQRPQNQYGAPVQNPSVQYLPGLRPANFQGGFSAQSDQQGGGFDQQPQGGGFSQQGVGFNQQEDGFNKQGDRFNPQEDRVNQQGGFNREEDRFNQPRGFERKGGGFNQQRGSGFEDFDDGSRRQLYQSPRQDVKTRQNFGVAGENYIPPTSTEGRSVEATTVFPERQPEDDGQPEDPNVAIATAVARGQYYVLLPDGKLQKVLYKTTQTEEDQKNNAVSAKLVYQDVQPLVAPIFTYSAPLVRIN